MSGQDTGKFREVGGAGHVETITSEDGRIEFVLEESGAAAPPLAARTAPQPAVVAVEASPGLVERLRALPRWTWALPLAAAGVGLLLWAGSGQESADAEQEPGGFRAYGGGPVDGQGARVRSAAPTRTEPAPDRAAQPTDFELGEGERGGEEVDVQGLDAVRQAMPAADAPPPMVPNSAFRSQELGTMNPGLTEEQRKLLQVNAPVKPPLEEVEPPIEEPAPEVLQEPQPGLEDYPTEQPVEPRGDLLPNGGYQEGLEGRDPDTIAPPTPTDPALNYPATAQPE